MGKGNGKGAMVFISDATGKKKKRTRGRSGCHFWN
jgi:hypothetical protein